jgi:hypothetical protein
VGISGQNFKGSWRNYDILMFFRPFMPDMVLNIFFKINYTDLMKKELPLTPFDR